MALSLYLAPMRNYIFIAALLLLLPACQKQDSGEPEAKVVKTGSEAFAAEKLRAGERAPSFNFPNLAGEEVSLTSLEGKVTLVNFWATWCVPCIAEMPSLERLYKTYQDKNFQIVAVSVDPPTQKDAVGEFVKKSGITFDILLDPEFSLAPEYGVTGFPESVFLDPEGRVIPFLDPDSGEKVLRVESDRPWDSKPYLEAVANILKEHIDDSNAS